MTFHIITLGCKVNIYESEIMREKMTVAGYSWTDLEHADITIINPDKEYTIDVNTFVSKGKNTPFDGYKVFGEVECTILGGKVVYKNDN